MPGSRRRRRGRVFVAATIFSVAAGAFFAQRLMELRHTDDTSPAINAGTEVSEGPPRSTAVHMSAAEEVPQPVEAPFSAETRSNEQPQSWRHDFYAADDRFSFATRAAKAAKDGDARAQYFLGYALRDCHVKTTLIAASGQGINEYLDQLPYVSESHRRKTRREVERCRRFFEAGALSESSLPPATETYEHWLEQSISNGDPLALMERSNLALGSLHNADEETEQRLKSQMRSDVRVAIASKEPAAIARVGGLFMASTVAHDQSLQGPAWYIAACELGYDCSSENPELAFVNNCADQPACLTLEDWFLRELGAGKYAEAYVAGQEIADGVRKSDWDALQRYLEMK